MKRAFSLINSVANNTRSKKPKLHRPIELVIQKKHWVSATKTKNFLQKDTLVDWLEVYAKKNRKFHDSFEQKESFTDFLFKKGIEFEEKVVKMLSENHEVVKVSDFYNASQITKTISYMKQGKPIIYSAPISNKGNRTYGIIDLLVRSDYLDEIIVNSPLTEEEKFIPAPKLNTPFHYVVIDIKFTTLPLASDGRHILNSARMPSYKSQIWVYNQAIGNIQGYLPRYGFMLGRRWKNKNRGVVNSNDSCLDKLGVIDYEERDKSYISKTSQAITWYRKVLNEGVHWDIENPIKKELYPNMCVDSNEWNITKEKLASNIGEITMLWQCGVRNRNIAFKNGIKSWRDQNCTSNKLGVYKSYQETVDKIININSENTNELFLPSKIQNNLKNWKSAKSNELFVDFETFSDICNDFDSLPLQKSSSIIYLIGVGWRNYKGDWKYRSFTCNKPTKSEEFRVMREFAEFIDSRNNPPMYFWCADESIWDRAALNQFDREDLTEDEKDIITYEWDFKDKWVDMFKIFKNEPIVVKGAFNFGLKTISKQMREHGMITTKIESECKSGMMAMLKAWNCYNNCENPVESSIMQDIITYNEFDCKVLNDIMVYIRANHT